MQFETTETWISGFLKYCHNGEGPQEGFKVSRNSVYNKNQIMRQAI